MSCATLVKVPLALKRLQRSEQCSYITGWFRTLANKTPSLWQALDTDVMPASRKLICCIILFDTIMFDTSLFCYVWWLYPAYTRKLSGSWCNILAYYVFRSLHTQSPMFFSYYSLTSMGRGFSQNPKSIREIIHQTIQFWYTELYFGTPFSTPK